tara:strand:+ start:587 stop:790 length:204 start_codon:yes stop_codon:yes gene_type:complete
MVPLPENTPNNIPSVNPDDHIDQVNPKIQYVIEDIPSVNPDDQFGQVSNTDILIYAIYNLINSINIY